MASPQRLAVKLCSLSPRALQNVEKRQFLSPKTPIKDSYKKSSECKGRLSPFNIDTPNRRRILEDGLPNKHGAVLGSGGFGTVYKASYKGDIIFYGKAVTHFGEARRNEEKSDQVAAKVMQAGRCISALNSEKRASLLKHSNIVKVLMVEEGASLSLITMELYGTTLQDCLDQEALPKNKRASILKEVTCALKFCHSAGIVHADVKPRNILMSADGQPKLTDFGCSVLIEEPNGSSEFRGTPGYIAPEVLKGSKPTPAADIYSLGIVAWQMISRQMPFDGLHSHTIIYLSAKGNRPEDDDIDDEFGGAYKTLYRKMWSQNVTSRPVTSGVINEIDALIAQ